MRMSNQLAREVSAIKFQTLPWFSLPPLLNLGSLAPRKAVARVRDRELSRCFHRYFRIGSRRRLGGKFLVRRTQMQNVIREGKTSMGSRNDAPMGHGGSFPPHLDFRYVEVRYPLWRSYCLC